jgi:hypothetical protein
MPAILATSAGEAMGKDAVANWSFVCFTLIVSLALLLIWRQATRH